MAAAVKQAASLGRRYGTVLPVALLLVAGMAVRLEHVDAPLVDSARQYHSAVLTRGYYYAHLSSAPAWKRHLASVNRRQELIIEPPALEFASSLVFRALGGEHLWVPRLLSSLFWVTGGLFLFLIARRLASFEGALLSLAVYLFLPYAVIESRSFQPDPLMVMAFLAALLLVLRYFERPGGSRLLAAGVAAGVAVLVKPGIVLLPLAGAFLGLYVARRREGTPPPGRQLLGFFALAIVPSAAYYLYGTAISGFLNGQLQQKLIPSLLVKPSFWKGLGGRLTDALSYPDGGRLVHAVGVVVLAAAVLAFSRIKDTRTRALLAGLWVGYGAFVLAFDYHASTHTYYHLPAIPIVALTLSGLLERPARMPRRTWVVPGVALLTAVLLAWSVQARSSYEHDFRPRVSVYQAIGALTHHSARLLFLDENYGGSLRYFGWVGGMWWPRESDLRGERLAGIGTVPAASRFTGRAPRYWRDQLQFRGAPDFFVVLDRAELADQRALRGLLRTGYRVLADSRAYLVFERRRSVAR